MNRLTVAAMLIVVGALQADAIAQVSSLGASKRQAMAAEPPMVASREAPQRERNLTYERYSWISLTPPAPKKFRPGDLLTVIVRERRSFEADADLQTKKQFDIKSDLQAFIKATAGGLGEAAFRRGNPNIDYKYQNRIKSEGDTNREDKLTTRITAKIIDVKPNGLLVLEAVSQVQHDEEISLVTLTGTCRKEDVTPDNTILSTQIADKNVVIKNEGALRAASRRGWIPKIIDWLNPL